MERFSDGLFSERESTNANIPWAVFKILFWSLHQPCLAKIECLVRTELKKKVKLAKLPQLKKKASLTVKIAMPSESTLSWSPAW